MSNVVLNVLGLREMFNKFCMEVHEHISQFNFNLHTLD